MIMSAGSAGGSPSSPPPPAQPASAAAVTPVGGITIRSAAGASSSPPQQQQQPSYNGPAVGQPPPAVVQPQPVAITPSPAPQAGGGGVSPVAMSSGVVRVSAGSTAASAQTHHYGPPQPSSVVQTPNQPFAAAVRPVEPAEDTRSQGPSPAAAAAAAAGKPRLTPGEMVSKADPLWVCGFILAVVAVAFATMAFEEEVSMVWLLLFVSVASVGAFVKLQL